MNVSVSICLKNAPSEDIHYSEVDLMEATNISRNLNEDIIQVDSVTISTKGFAVINFEILDNAVDFEMTPDALNNILEIAGVFSPTTVSFEQLHEY